MYDFQSNFIEYALSCKALRFGEFKLKSGRVSPYFFNAGCFNSGFKLAKVGEFYAQALRNSGLQVDVLYGPAYKGISLVSAVAIAYAQAIKKDIPFAFNRKEAKDHGEGGNLIGAALAGNVLIVDDVITAGISVRTAVNIITNNNANPCGVLVALDRQENGQNNISTIQEVEQELSMPLISLISLDNIVEFMQHKQQYNKQLAAITHYRKQPS